MGKYSLESKKKSNTFSLVSRTSSAKPRYFGAVRTMLRWSIRVWVSRSNVLRYLNMKWSQLQRFAVVQWFSFRFLCLNRLFVTARTESQSRHKIHVDPRSWEQAKNFATIHILQSTIFHMDSFCARVQAEHNFSQQLIVIFPHLISFVWLHSKFHLNFFSVRIVFSLFCYRILSTGYDANFFLSSLEWYEYPILSIFRIVSFFWLQRNLREVKKNVSMK